MKNVELSASELESVVGAATREDAVDRGLNLGDCPNVTANVQPI